MRLYKINTPLADWHSWRQADTAAVARNFVEKGYDLLHPRFDDLSSVPSGKENPEGWRFVEFPLYNATHALFFQAIEAVKPGLISFEAAGRLVSIISSILAALFLYLIVKRFWGWLLGILSLFFFLFLPYNIYYSRTILPGPMMLSLSLASVHFLLRAEEIKKKKEIILFLSLVLAAAAILVKPYAIFILLPSWAFIFISWFLRVKEKKSLLLASIGYALLSLLPFLVWRWWMRQFPEGIPANAWLLNMGNIRFRPAWWRWIFAERIGKLILGYWGVIFLGVGVALKRSWKKDLFFYFWLIGAFAYLSIFARGNVQHDYYQLVIVPVLAVFLARGFAFLSWPPKEHFHRLLSPAFSVLFLLFALAFSWYNVRGYYQINHPEIVEAGKAADSLLPPEAKVIAPYGGDTAFLYQTKRKGWPVVTGSMEEMLKLGATHYVSVNFDSTTNYLLQRCLVLGKSEKWVIIDLRSCDWEQKGGKQ